MALAFGFRTDGLVNGTGSDGTNGACAGPDDGPENGAEGDLEGAGTGTKSS